MSSTRATMIGFSAVAMWALLALLTDASGKVPPFLLSAICFAIGTCVGLAARPFAGRVEKVRAPGRVWLIGIAGLFGYHFFYFRGSSFQLIELVADFLMAARLVIAVVIYRFACVQTPTPKGAICSRQSFANYSATKNNVDMILISGERRQNSKVKTKAGHCTFRLSLLPFDLK